MVTIHTLWRLSPDGSFSTLHSTSTARYAPNLALSPSQVVITPHVYPPTITHATFLGTTLWDQCRTAFGYLQDKGFCPASGGDCKVRGDNSI